MELALWIIVAELAAVIVLLTFGTYVRMNVLAVLLGRLFEEVNGKLNNTNQQLQIVRNEVTDAIQQWRRELSR